MANKGLGYALMGLSGLAQGYMGQQEKNRLAEQNALDRSLKAKALDLQAKKDQADVDKLTGEFMGQGLMKDASGQIVANPDYYTEGSPLYNVEKQKSAFKAMQSHQSQNPHLMWDDIYAAKGQPVPDALRGKVVPDSVAAAQMKPTVQPTDQQLKDYRTIVGGDPTGLTAAQMANGIAQVVSQQSAAERAARAQSAADQRFNKGEERRNKQFETQRDFERRKIVNQGTQQITGEITKNGLTPMVHDFDVIDKYTGLFSKQNPDLTALASPGESAAGAIPLVGGTAQSWLAKSRGAGAVPVQQATQNILNNAMKAISGGAVTASEDVRNRIARGLSPGAPRESIAEGLKAAADIHRQMESNIFAGSDPEAVSEYKKRPGSYKTLDEVIQSRINNPSNQRAGAANKQAPTRVQSAQKLNISPKQLSAIDQYPKPGDVKEGYRYKGGDPSLPASWEKVK